ncbi:MAG: O-antigen ligase family protein [Alphaproteobacteria bacterium]|nr:O-antigen ligase family protein [Alphaproteobacteria bacterium]MBU1552256.1 O-antigen ligase family protein [Alphaproteobacteria bacterium]MBU2336836.1 O-antigen ligase family protein [Alphaproteobacteria bacterium]MBU2389592.1 O-antigen ligase family protein [Alphaproteobacteria bacterium]
MPEHIRALAYVLILAIPAFFVAARLAVPLVGAREFSLWRNAWIAATGLTFLSTSFLMFVALLALLIVLLRKKLCQPLHLYIILMFTAPCLGVGVGIPGLFNRLIDLNPPRVLALLILLPMAVTLWAQPQMRRLRKLDVSVVAFCAMLSILAFRHGDFNSIFRVIPGYWLDIVLSYFVFSRAVRTADDLDRCLMAFVVAALPLALVGIFEYLRDWRIYFVVVLRWDLTLISPYVFRDGSLRAAATAIEPIAFGFLCMVGAAALLAIRSRRVGLLWWWLAMAMLVGGLFVSLSRGPWLGFALCVVIVLLARPRLALALSLVAVPTAALMPYLGPVATIDRFINLLPFIGHADEGSEAYRSQLLESSWTVIGRNPWFGSMDFLSAPELQVLIQGQGIIDIVNSYIQIALEYGLVSLSLFVVFFVAIVASLARLTLANPQATTPYHALLGLMLGILFTIGTTSSVSIIPHIYWALSGLSVAAVAMARAQARSPASGMAIQGQPAINGSPPEVAALASAAPMRVLGRGI